MPMHEFDFMPCMPAGFASTPSEVPLALLWTSCSRATPEGAMDQAPDISLFAPPRRRPKKSSNKRPAPAADTPATRPSDEPARANGQPLLPTANGSGQHSTDTDSREEDGEPAKPALEGAEHGVAKADSLSDSAASFRDLGVSAWLDRVCRSLGMTTPTQVSCEWPEPWYGVFPAGNAPSAKQGKGILLLCSAVLEEGIKPRGGLAR